MQPRLHIDIKDWLRIILILALTLQVACSKKKVEQGTTEDAAHTEDATQTDKFLHSSATDTDNKPALFRMDAQEKRLNAGVNNIIQITLKTGNPDAELSNFFVSAKPLCGKGYVQGKQQQKRVYDFALDEACLAMLMLDQGSDVECFRKGQLLRFCIAYQPEPQAPTKEARDISITVTQKNAKNEVLHSETKNIKVHVKQRQKKAANQKKEEAPVENQAKQEEQTEKELRMPT